MLDIVRKTKYGWIVEPDTVDTLFVRSKPTGSFVARQLLVQDLTRHIQAAPLSQILDIVKPPADPTEPYVVSGLGRICILSVDGTLPYYGYIGTEFYETKDHNQIESAHSRLAVVMGATLSDLLPPLTSV